ncbi:hypothetical protein CIL03_04005 [Virgibacillus indicus]|uniref:Magnesium transporter MgtE intracellular domain-containing protein n=1 Tax=Virgibacillus indicus TaxID=2024554 RepID=A0A265NE54_9BACI|nr:hypothetical protein [Virgibacillus indicus]OZU90318.1 hypothetical protein CIL03_04005 [Virgibacillus indicus]
MSKDVKTEMKKMNPILWFLFAIVIPVAVALTLTVIIFAVAGVNVIDWAKEKGNNIPVISSLITTPDENKEEQQKERVQETAENKDAEIEQLQQETNDLQATIETLEQEIEKLENRNTSRNEAEGDEAEEPSPLKTISDSFKDMDSEQAAGILQNLDNEMAVSILKEVSNKVRGELLGEMEAEKAAELTQLFISTQH